MSVLRAARCLVPLALPLRLRGGALALGDHTGAAVELFSNMRVPAALIAGAVVPYGFAAMPKPAPGDGRRSRVLKVLHAYLATFTMMTELVTVVYATIAVNKLREMPHAPTESVFALMQQNYEMGWLGANVHFFSGLISLATMSSLSVWLHHGALVGRAAALAAAAAVSLMLAVVNHGIDQGGGGGSRFGANLFGVVVRYLRVLFRNGFRTGPRWLLWSCLALTAAAAVTGVQALGAAWELREGDG